jgi:hypothetical protein
MPIYFNYKGKSVNRSQMDIKHKTCDLLLDISSPNIATFVPPISQCVETHSIEIF